MKPHYLSPFFSPRHIAVIGASDKTDSLGHTIFANLITHCDSSITISPVNLRHAQVGGMTTVRSIKNLKNPPDLAIVITPPSSYESVLQDCHQAKVPFVLLIQTDKKPHRDDLTLTQNAISLASQLGIKLLGPTHVGLIRTSPSINAGVYRGKIKSAGRIALVSQSSSVCSAILDWATEKGFGFSTVLAMDEGSSNLSFGEVLDFLVYDDATDAIVLDMHHTTHARQLISALYAASLVKPVIVFKSGRFEQPVQAATVHIANTVPADEVFHRVMVRTGVIQVRNFAQLFSAIRLLNIGRQLDGERLAVITNGSGLSEITQDVIYDVGTQLATFSTDTQKILSKALQQKTVNNPLDIGADAGSLRFRTVVKASLEDPSVDAVLVIYAPQMDHPAEHLQTAEMMLQLQNEIPDKPLLLSWIGGDAIAPCRALFAQNRCLHFDMPEFAVNAFQHMVRFYRNQQQRLILPIKTGRKTINPDIPSIHHLFQAACKKDNTCILNQEDTAKLLNSFDIPHTLNHPQSLNFNERMAKISISRDAVFGPIVVFSACGDIAIHKDYAIALPPLNDTVIDGLIKRVRISKSFASYRGQKPIRLSALYDVFYAVSEIIIRLPEIHELTLDLQLSEKEVVATRAHVLLGKNNTKDRYEHMAIMPYPARFEKNITLKNGLEVLIRPIREDDGQLLQNFVRQLSDHARYNRFLSNVKELSNITLVKLTRLDYARNMAFVMVHNPQTEEETILGVARYVTDPDMESCEFAVSVLDTMQRQGIGSILMEHLCQAAQEQGLKNMRGEVLMHNTAMHALMQRLQFTITQDTENPELLLVYKTLA